MKRIDQTFTAETRRTPRRRRELIHRSQNFFRTRRGRAEFADDNSRSLIRQHATADARTWLTRLQELTPNTFETIALEARLLAVQEQGEAAQAFRIPSRCHDSKYRGGECGDYRDVQFGFIGHRSLPSANL